MIRAIYILQSKIISARFRERLVEMLRNDLTRGMTLHPIIFSTK